MPCDTERQARVHVCVTVLVHAHKRACVRAPVCARVASGSHGAAAPTGAMNSAPREPRQFHEISRAVRMLFERSTAHNAVAARCPPLLCAMSSDTSDGSARRRCEPECTLVVSAAATPRGDVGSTPRERSSAMTSQASARAWRKAMGARQVPYDAARATRRARATGTCDTSAQHTAQHEPVGRHGPLRLLMTVWKESQGRGLAGPAPVGSGLPPRMPSTRWHARRKDCHDPHRRA
jgi:hypothetical protein